ncbi:MAG: hydroxychlorobactene glucosyltransferase CruC [Anaerolineales bacterium]
MFLWYQAFASVVMVYVVLTTLYNLRFMPRLPSDAPLPADLPLVSVLVPARNEERNIGACLESLRAQDYPNLEILVLDDESSDATAAIVEAMARQDGRVRLLRGQPLQPGWHGKTWACHQLAQAARGEWLLFADADTRHRPNSVSSALALAHARSLDLLSLIPDMGLKGFWERVMMAVIPLVFVGCVPHFVFTRTRTPILAAAIGPFMLFRRETYERFGGHEAVRADIVEDVFIARWVKRAGGRIALADGVDTLRVDFYNGFRETWNGLSKSTFAAFDYSLTGILAAITAFVALFLGPYAVLYHAWRAGLTDLAHFSLPFTQVVLAWVAMWFINGRFTIPRRYAMLIGLTVLMAALFCFNSIGSSMFGAGTVWKGRAYQFRHRSG